MKTAFFNLRLVTSNGVPTSGVIIEERGKLVSVSYQSEKLRGLIDTCDQKIDLGGHLVLPGVIDGHVHFDDPGFTQREDFAHGTRAAAAGGVTCVVDMPCTSIPPVTSKKNLEQKLNAISPKAHVDFMLWGGVSGDLIKATDWQQSLQDLAKAGIAAIKVYLTSGMDTFKDLTRDEIETVVREAKTLGIPVGVHAEEKVIVEQLTKDLQSKGRNSLMDYAKSRPARAEVEAIRFLVDLCRKTGGHIHIVHLGSGEGLDLIARAREDGLLISCETCPHFLAFTENDLKNLGSILKTAPVIKKAKDRERLWHGLSQREISFVATDHAAGKWPEEKSTGSAWTDYGGIPGTELLLSYLYSEGVKKGRITLPRMIELLSSGPAQFFGVNARKGSLAPGYDADFTIFDDAATWTVASEHLHNLNRYTPFEGCTMTGRVMATYVRGQQVFERLPDGKEFFGKPGIGTFIRRLS